MNSFFSTESMAKNNSVILKNLSIEILLEFLKKLKFFQISY